MPCGGSGSPAGSTAAPVYCDGQKDCFVRHSAIPGQGFKSLTEGDRVECDVVAGQKGPAAENVARLGQ